MMLWIRSVSLFRNGRVRLGIKDDALMCDYLLPHREVWLFNLLLKIHNNVSKCWDDLFLFLCEKKKENLKKPPPSSWICNGND